MSENVWLLTKGSYSDYTVLAVFSTEAGASAAKDAGLGEDVESKPLDPALILPPEGYRRICIEMTYDGDVPFCREELFPPEVVPGIEAIQPSYLDWSESRQVFYGILWAADEKHAVKIANDLRAQFIATKALQT